MSEPGEDQEPDTKSLAQRAADLLVFAPAGLVVTALEDLPELTEKGRSTLTSTLRNAHVVGRFTVELGRRELQRRIESFERTPGTPRTVSRAGSTSHPGRTSTVQPHAGAHDDDRGARGPVGGPVAAPIPRSDHLAIPGYDTLSASQVVRRLDGLGPRELEAVYKHESATRRRRTVLHRAQQLLGTERVPGAPEPPSPPGASETDPPR